MRKMMMILMLALGVSFIGFAQTANRSAVKQAREAIENVKKAPQGTSYGIVEETSEKYVIATPLGNYTLKKEKDGSVTYKGLFLKRESQEGNSYVVNSTFGRFQINLKELTVKKL